MATVEIVIKVSCINEIDPKTVNQAMTETTLHLATDALVAIGKCPDQVYNICPNHDTNYPESCLNEGHRRCWEDFLTKRSLANVIKVEEAK